MSGAGDSLTLDPSNPFEAVLADMLAMHRKKARDYAGDAHPNANFYHSGAQIGLTAGHSVEQLIATKQARLRVLLPNFWASEDDIPANESIEDTLLDRAVYSVLAMTIYREGGYATSTVPFPAGGEPVVPDADHQHKWRTVGTHNGVEKQDCACGHSRWEPGPEPELAVAT